MWHASMFLIVPVPGYASGCMRQYIQYLHVAKRPSHQVPSWPQECCASIGCVSFKHIVYYVGICRRWQPWRVPSNSCSWRSVTLSVLIDISLQIASGMCYLAGHHYIHRDLAARNCLIHQNFTVKITDFGTSGKLHSSHYHQVEGIAKMLPIRWMAHECFCGQFLEKSDVWAFGVTMWEIFSLCQARPYDSLSNQEVIDNALKGPDCTHLGQPCYCPDCVYDIMKRCWIHELKERASFNEIHHLLSKVCACNV